LKKCILHCDLNNFYASVECLYNPELRDKPVAVCGSQEARHGIVLAKNYIAKGFGIKTGETIWEAKNKCPNLCIVPPNFSLYLNFSKSAKQIYSDYTDCVESFGIDECWLDITKSQRLFGCGEEIAYIIKDRIKNELGITASVGVSFNKIFAKLGSDIKKPDAVTVISEDNFKDIVWSLPVEELLYVGKATKIKLNRAAIYTIGSLANTSPDFLKQILGKWGDTLWLFANGKDSSPVSHINENHYIKSVGNSLTSSFDLKNNNDAKVLIYILSESVGERLRKYCMKGSTIQLSIKDNNLYQIEKQEKLEHPTYITREIAQKAYQIFIKNWNWRKPVRALGVRICELMPEDTSFQLSLFYNSERQKKMEDVDKCVDKLRERYGHYSIQRGNILKEDKLKANPIEDNIIFPKG
jgi:DNA polymerase-4